MNRYRKTAALSARELTNGGVIYLLPDIVLRAFTLIPLTYLWRVVMSSGAQAGMTLPQMLTYTYVSALLADMLVVRTPATGWLSEGVLRELSGLDGIADISFTQASLEEGLATLFAKWEGAKILSSLSPGNGL